MIRVGITGGLATGKSTVLSMFEELGARVIDADGIVHELLEDNAELKRKVCEAVGEVVLTVAGKIDRNRMASVVFADREKLEALVKILHPEVIERIRLRFSEIEKECQVSLAAAEVPLLIEEGTLEIYDVIVLVAAREDLQLKRYLERPGSSRDDFQSRLRNQLPLDEKRKYADHVIENNGSLEETAKQVKVIWDKVLSQNKLKIEEQEK